MKYLDLIATVLLIIGGLNWGLVGLFDFNLVSAIFNNFPDIQKLLYILIGLAALWGIYLLSRCKEYCHHHIHDRDIRDTRDPRDPRDTTFHDK